MAFVFGIHRRCPLADCDLLLRNGASIVLYMSHIAVIELFATMNDARRHFGKSYIQKRKHKKMDLSNLPSIGRDLLNARMHRAKVGQPSCPLKLHEQEKKVLVAQNYSAVRGPVNAMREQFFFGERIN